MDTLINLDCLSEEEKSLILSVIERDDELKLEQHRKVMVLKTEIHNLRKQSILRGEDNSNKICIRCRKQFGFFFDTGEICSHCKYKICSMCRETLVSGGWLCCLCFKQMQLKWMTGEWIYGTTKKCPKYTQSGGDVIKASIRRSASKGNITGADDNGDGGPRISKPSSAISSRDDLDRITSPQDSDKMRLSHLFNSFKPGRTEVPDTEVNVQRISCRRRVDSDTESSSSEDSNQLSVTKAASSSSAMSERAASKQVSSETESMVDSPRIQNKNVVVENKILSILENGSMVAVDGSCEYSPASSKLSEHQSLLCNRTTLPPSQENASSLKKSEKEEQLLHTNKTSPMPITISSPKSESKVQPGCKPTSVQRSSSGRSDNSSISLSSARTASPGTKMRLLDLASRRALERDVSDFDETLSQSSQDGSEVLGKHAGDFVVEGNSKVRSLHHSKQNEPSFQGKRTSIAFHEHTHGDSEDDQRGNVGKGIKDWEEKLSKKSVSHHDSYSVSKSPPMGDSNVIPTPGHVATITPAHVASITPGHVAPITPDHVASITPGHATTITPGHVNTINPGHATTITTGHETTITPGDATTTIPGHATTITPGHITSSSPEHVSSGHHHGSDTDRICSKVDDKFVSDVCHQLCALQHLSGMVNSLSGTDPNSEHSPHTLTVSTSNQSTECKNTEQEAHFMHPYSANHHDEQECCFTPSTRPVVDGEGDPFSGRSVKIPDIMQQFFDGDDDLSDCLSIITETTEPNSDDLDCTLSDTASTGTVNDDDLEKEFDQIYSNNLMYGQYLDPSSPSRSTDHVPDADHVVKKSHSFRKGKKSPKQERRFKDDIPSRNETISPISTDDINMHQLKSTPTDFNSNVNPTDLNVYAEITTMGVVCEEVEEEKVFQATNKSNNVSKTDGVIDDAHPMITGDHDRIIINKSTLHPEVIVSDASTFDHTAMEKVLSEDENTAKYSQFGDSSTVNAINVNDAENNIHANISDSYISVESNEHSAIQISPQREHSKSVTVHSPIRPSRGSPKEITSVYTIVKSTVSPKMHSHTNVVVDSSNNSGDVRTNDSSTISSAAVGSNDVDSRIISSAVICTNDVDSSNVSTAPICTNVVDSSNVSSAAICTNVMDSRNISVAAICTNAHVDPCTNNQMASVPGSTVVITSSTNSQVYSNTDTTVASNTDLPVDSNTKEPDSDSKTHVDSSINSTVHSNTESLLYIKQTVDSDVSAPVDFKGHIDSIAQVDSDIQPTVDSDFGAPVDFKGHIDSIAQVDFSAPIDCNSSVDSGIQPTEDSDSSALVDTSIQPTVDSEFSAQVDSNLKPTLDSEFSAQVHSNLKPTLDSEFTAQVDSSIQPTLDSEFSAQVDSSIQPTLDSVSPLLLISCHSPCSALASPDQHHSVSQPADAVVTVPIVTITPGESVEQENLEQDSNLAPHVKVTSETGSDETGSHGGDSGHISGTSAENTPEHKPRSQQHLSIPSLVCTSADEKDVDEDDEDIDDLVSIMHSRNTLALRSHLTDSRESLYSIYSDAGEINYGKIPVTGEILFGIDYNYRTGALEVYIKQCKDLAPVDTKRNRSDPYVKTYLLPDKTRSGKRKTKIKKHTLNPTFDEVIRYVISKSEVENRVLWVTVWHNDRFGRNDFLGEVMISLECYKFGDSSPRWYLLQERLELPENSLSYKGDLVMSLKFVTPDHIESPTKKGKTKKSKDSSRGELHVFIKESRNLTAVRSNGSSDPFCKGYLLPEKNKSVKQKTPVVKRNCNPEWNHMFVFDDLALDELKNRSLELTVWDHDRLTSNDFLGGVRLNLGTGVYNGVTAEWMDARGEEIYLWQSMVERPNSWVKATIGLRHTMGKSEIKK